MRKKLSKCSAMALMLIVLLQVFMPAEEIFAAYSPSAMALGFQLDLDYYKNVGYVSEKTVSAYVTDDEGNKVKCGELSSQTLYATSKTKYLTDNQLDVWLTRSYTEPIKAKCKMRTWLVFKENINVQFSISKVVENDKMPSNIKLSSYMATSPSQITTKTVSSGWTINTDRTLLSCKNISLGMSSGVSWTTEKNVDLCEIYNESRKDRFKVTYELLDPWYNVLTNKQKSFCNNLNYYYTAKYVYGTPSSMKTYLAPTHLTATFRGNYTYAGMSDVEIFPLFGSATYSVNARIGG